VDAEEYAKRKRSAAARKAAETNGPRRTEPNGENGHLDDEAREE